MQRSTSGPQTCYANWLTASKKTNSKLGIIRWRIMSASLSGRSTLTTMVNRSDAEWTRRKDAPAQPQPARQADDRERLRRGRGHARRQGQGRPGYGRTGGKARNDKMSPERRWEIAQTDGEKQTGRRRRGERRGPKWEIEVES